VQNAICLEDNQPYLHRRVEILVEGLSKTSRKHAETGSLVQLVGRTVCDRIVVFDGSLDLTGKILNVEIERVDAFTLYGKICNAVS
jgi:tRNA-2-methylthio-N6-dimethylallyladenosine synthase